MVLTLSFKLDSDRDDDEWLTDLLTTRLSEDFERIYCLEGPIDLRVAKEGIVFQRASGQEPTSVFFSYGIERRKPIKKDEWELLFMGLLVIGTIHV